MTTIGFIGLGRMGAPMARHIRDAGYNLSVFDTRTDAISAIDNVTATDSVADLGCQSDIVFLSLPGPSVVESVISELEEVLQSDMIVIDTTTSTPETSQMAARIVTENDASFLGAPVSGGTDGAISGTLTVMAGGDHAVFDESYPIIDTFASNIIHVGADPGHGHATKLLNNFLSITAMVATSEAVSLGEEIGLDVETMCAVFNTSSGRNSATQDKFPECATEGRDVGFSLGLLNKDIQLFREFAAANDLPLLLGPVVATEAARAQVTVGPDGDMTDIYDYVRAAIGTDD